MIVQHIPCGAAANASEELAAERCVAALQALGDYGRWVVLSSLASSSSALHQSDELDLVCIGPGGVVLIEDKHWDTAWMRDHRVTVEAEAEKLTASAKRLAGREFRSIQLLQKCRGVTSGAICPSPGRSRRVKNASANHAAHLRQHPCQALRRAA
jgi:hypothetical protein